MEPTIILGPPGTGKTTTLLNVVENALERGVKPNRIGYFTFTRRAAEEAMQRACDKFSLDPRDLPYFRTLHSLCFRELALTRQEVFEGSKLSSFGAWAGTRITGRGWSEDGTLMGFEIGDRILFAENLARVRMTSLRDQYERDYDGLPWREVERVATALAKFKEKEGLLDFTDMLSEFLRRGITIPFDELVIDEAQDQSLLQWKVVELLAKRAKNVTIAGDDDQAIYRWAGADVDYLIDLRGDSRVLGRSYRVPPAIQSVANDIIGGVRHRRVKEWEARKGVVGKVGRFDHFNDVDTDEKSVLVLARNSYVLKEQVEDELRRQGVVFEKNGHPSIKAAYLQAIEAWETLRTGKPVPVEQVRHAYEYLTVNEGVKHGFKKLAKFKDETEEVTIDRLEKEGGLLTRAIWHEALSRLPPSELSYMLAARRRGEKFRSRPRIRISTIHASKGGEADHVVVMKEMARRTFKEIETNEEDERRVWYVAVTRARERLSIVESQSRACPFI